MSHTSEQVKQVKDLHDKYQNEINFDKNITDDFEEKYKDIEWGVELEWFDTLENFLNEKFNSHVDIN